MEIEEMDDQNKKKTDKGIGAEEQEQSIKSTEIDSQSLKKTDKGVEIEEQEQMIRDEAVGIEEK